MWKPPEFPGSTGRRFGNELFVEVKLASCDGNEMFFHLAGGSIFAQNAQGHLGSGFATDQVYDGLKVAAIERMGFPGGLADFHNLIACLCACSIERTPGDNSTQFGKAFLEI